MTSSTAPSSAPSARERSLAVITAWIIGAKVLPRSVLPETADDLAELVVELGLISAGFLTAWALEIGVNPQELLADIALGQALDDVTRDAVEK